MSNSGIDALAPLPMAQVHDGPSTPPRTSGARPPVSLLDDWENWPENDPRFDPVFDGAWPPSGFYKCKHPECEYCSETKEVFHVSEYTADGQSVMDKKVNTKELHDHLQELQRLDQSNVKTPNHPSARLFFACGNYVHHGLEYKYMRHFLAYCRIPPHFVLREADDDCLPVFQAAYEPKVSKGAPSEPQRGILHIYLHCLCYVRGTDIMANPKYYSNEFEPHIRNWVELSNFSPFCPTLYLRYNEASRGGELYVADSAKTFHSLCGIFSGGFRGANDDPFLLVAVFLQHRLAELRKFVNTKRYTVTKSVADAQGLKSLDTDAVVLFTQFDRLLEGRDNARMRHEVSSLLRALQLIKAEHELFLAREGDTYFQGEAARRVRQRFQQQHAQLEELESAFADCLKQVEVVKDLMIGRAQILNGIDMAKMAKDNQKQALATEALALDARRDSEIMKRDSATMKTITVVTLVYLPATFVSTLLSMGLFDFGVGDDGNGRLRVAREGWVFLAISLPLTILTLGLAFLWKQSKERQWASEAEEAKAKAKAKANAATQQQEKSTAGNGDGAPQAQAPEPPASADAAPASRWQPLLARLPHLRRRPAPQEKTWSGTETV